MFITFNGNAQDLINKNGMHNTERFTFGFRLEEDLRNNDITLYNKIERQHDEIMNLKYKIKNLEKIIQTIFKLSDNKDLYIKYIELLLESK